MLECQEAQAIFSSEYLGHDDPIEQSYPKLLISSNWISHWIRGKNFLSRMAGLGPCTNVFFFLPHWEKKRLCGNLKGDSFGSSANEFEDLRNMHFLWSLDSNLEGKLFFVASNFAIPVTKKNRKGFVLTWWFQPPVFDLPSPRNLIPEKSNKKTTHASIKNH